MLTVQIDREKASRYGLNMGDVQDAISTAFGGREAGTVFEGDDVSHPGAPARGHAQRCGQHRPPADCAAAAATGVWALCRCHRWRRWSWHRAQPGQPRGRQAPHRGQRQRARRDIGSFVAQAQQELEGVALPAGYWTRWGGTFENLESARKRLMIVVPVALALVFTLLFAMFGNVRDGLIVFTGIPFALTGGIAALWLRGIPLSISAAIGFIALCGVAVLNGLVMIPISAAARAGHGRWNRPSPKGAHASASRADDGPGGIAGLCAHGDCHRNGGRGAAPLATVVIGGILSSTVLTLLVLPLLYRLGYGERK
jgi:cobalt-zinc-cadmium resistance protein CzcA